METLLADAGYISEQTYQKTHKRKFRLEKTLLDKEYIGVCS